jgi:hypothetical protein
MKMHRKLIVLFFLGVFVFSGIAATRPAESPNFEKLESIMRGFNKSLGVKCNFCHARSEDNKMDFASDKKGEKEIARDMMRMTLKINKKFFHVKKPAIGDSSSVVSCITCHHGNAHIE